MTHIVGCVEGYWEFIDKFLKYFHGKEYAGGKAKVRARAMIPVHFGINECGRDEFLKDLKDFMATEGSDHSDGGKTKKAYFRLMGLVRRFFPKLKDISKEVNKMQGSGLRWAENKQGNHFIVGFYLAGEISDEHVDGVEIV